MFELAARFLEYFNVKEERGYFCGLERRARWLAPALLVRPRRLARGDGILVREGGCRYPRRCTFLTHTDIPISEFGLQYIHLPQCNFVFCALWYGTCAPSCGCRYDKI